MTATSATNSMRWRRAVRRVTNGHSTRLPHGGAPSATAAAPAATSPAPNTATPALPSVRDVYPRATAAPTIGAVHTIVGTRTNNTSSKASAAATRAGSRRARVEDRRRDERPAGREERRPPGAPPREEARGGGRGDCQHDGWSEGVLAVQQECSCHQRCNHCRNLHPCVDPELDARDERNHDEPCELHRIRELDEEGEQADQDECPGRDRGHPSHRPSEARAMDGAAGAHKDQFRSERHRYERERARPPPEAEREIPGAGTDQSERHRERIDDDVLPQSGANRLAPAESLEAEEEHQIHECEHNGCCQRSRGEWSPRNAPAEQRPADAVCTVERERREQHGDHAVPRVEGHAPERVFLPVERVERTAQERDGPRAEDGCRTGALIRGRARETNDRGEEHRRLRGGRPLARKEGDVVEAEGDEHAEHDHDPHRRHRCSRRREEQAGEACDREERPRVPTGPLRLRPGARSRREVDRRPLGGMGRADQPTAVHPGHPLAPLRLGRAAPFVSTVVSPA